MRCEVLTPPLFTHNSIAIFPNFKYSNFLQSLPTVATRSGCHRDGGSIDDVLRRRRRKGSQFRIPAANPTSASTSNKLSKHAHSSSGSWELGDRMSSSIVSKERGVPREHDALRLDVVPVSRLVPPVANPST